MVAVRSAILMVRGAGVASAETPPKLSRSGAMDFQYFVSLIINFGAALPPHRDLICPLGAARGQQC